jgi:hypothetical protein
MQQVTRFLRESSIGDLLKTRWGREKNCSGMICGINPFNLGYSLLGAVNAGRMLEVVQCNIKIIVLIHDVFPVL